MPDTTTCSTPKPRAGIKGLDVYRVAVEFYRFCASPPAAAAGT